MDYYLIESQLLPTGMALVILPKGSTEIEAVAKWVETFVSDKFTATIADSLKATKIETVLEAK